MEGGEEAKPKPDSPSEEYPPSHLMLPTNEVEWFDVFTERDKEGDSKHPDLGLVYNLRRQHFQESGQFGLPTERHMPLLSISESAKRPTILRHIQIHVHNVKLSRLPTPESPVWVCLELRCPARRAVRLREAAMTELKHLASIVYPALSGHLQSTQAPIPMADLSLPPGCVLELQTDSAIVDVGVQVALYVSDI